MPGDERSLKKSYRVCDSVTLPDIASRPLGHATDEKTV